MIHSSRLWVDNTPSGDTGPNQAHSVDRQTVSFRRRTRFAIDSLNIPSSFSALFTRCSHYEIKFVALPFPLPRRGSHLLDTFSPHSLQQGSTATDDSPLHHVRGIPRRPVTTDLGIISAAIRESATRYGSTFPEWCNAGHTKEHNSHALPPTQSVSCFDTLTRFLAAQVDRVAFCIF